ncbi:MAG: 50S ribosomal protein L24 [Candidatus Diapherotrites archaeon]|nr:50S ribosomal protein L24 [Candidatus Diapherotrites archaeon]
MIQSGKPSSQRKFFYSKPLHLAKKNLSSHLSKELREKFGVRAFTLHKGDTVEIMRGSFKGKKGKVHTVNYSQKNVIVEGIVRKKVSGQEVAVPLQASNLRLMELELTDKKRIESLERKGKHKKTENKGEK